MTLGDGILCYFKRSATCVQNIMEFEPVILPFHLLQHADTDLQERLASLDFIQTYRAELLGRAADSVMPHGRITLKPLLRIVAAFMLYAREHAGPVEAGATIITLLAIRGMKGYLQCIIGNCYGHVKL